MNLESVILSKIISECNKIIEKYHAYHNAVHTEWLRQRKRIRLVPCKEIKTPEYWDIDRRFNPFYVKSNAKAIAKSIARKINSATYVPEEPYSKEIPKSSGGVRNLTIYQIPDAAVSRYFYERLLNKNKHRFSSFSYAYRSDRNVHFAIQDISVDLQNDARTFIAEFDFSDFFGSIEHNYLYAQFSENGFLISEEEERVIRAFLNLSGRGIPQGTSISLFLANLVCWKLDKSFEKEGLKFARYADDTVVWSQDYAKICKSFVLIENFSKEVGVKINVKKSDGISLLARDGLRAEISPKQSFDFLGYSIGVGRSSIKKTAELRIKKQISYLLYRNLIKPIQNKPFVSLIVPTDGKDQALLMAIMQIRRYMYGGLMLSDIRDYLKGRRRWLDFKGVMSFYPLVNDLDQLRSLDGWLLSAVYRALKHRAKLFRYHGISCSHLRPFTLDRNQLLVFLRKTKVGGEKILELPSFVLIYHALQKGVREHGVERVMHPESVKYDYTEKYMRK